ncbi:MAG: hypothetical protein KJN64_14975 [Ignavibacteria bacterium]|nr:hypothetical protein [Ignavibacteria bacterium]MBT8391109.1 hypothetical protein [Ignavibacteria bacterium]NNJ53676.1 hypothetical protein [Ignavibacteriaceae bacterium]
MKNILTYIVLFLTGLILFSCDKPAPTELVDDLTDDFEIEILTKDLNNNITSGADTSGITQDITGITNLISVSGIKLTSNNKTNRFSLAQAFFFDKSNPVYGNGRLLGFKTITPGNLKFDGLEARKVPYEIRYVDMGIPKNVLLGEKYVLYNIWQGIPDSFYYNYNSSIYFEFKPNMGQGNNMNFNIATPHEINGNVIINGRKQNRNIEAILEWNGKGQKRISVIVGVIKQGQINSIPIYRIRTRDDGRLRIPKRFFSELPFGELEKVVFTFVRIFESFHQNGNNELFVSSQSIHSIVIDIP